MEEPLDNAATEWRASIKDWLKEGLVIQRRLEGEADRHSREAKAKRKLARILRHAFEDLGVKAPPSRK